MPRKFLLDKNFGLKMSTEVLCIKNTTTNLYLLIFFINEILSGHLPPVCVTIRKFSAYFGNIPLPTPKPRRHSQILLLFGAIIGGDVNY